MLLLHLTLGLLIAIPFFVFAATHAKRMIRMWNKRAKYAGLAIFTLAVVCVSTGVFMTFRGATLNNRAVWLAHVASVPLALVAFILHRRAHTHKLQFRRLYAWGGAVAVFLGAMAVLAKLEKPPKRIVNVNGDTVFYPSSSETFDQGLLDGKKLAANEYCQSCHPDSFHQWERSAHRFSSFNNPFYRKSVELMADRVGRERTKWCSGCHDPVVLFTGQMGAATQAKFSYDSWEAQQGLTCMSCHSIAEVKDVKGNGSYVIEESKQYPFAFSTNTTLAAVNRLLIRMEPSLHRKTFLKPFTRTPEFCSTCHKVALIPAAQQLPLDAGPEPLRHLVRLGRLGPRGSLLLRPAAGRRPAATATCRRTARTSSATRRAISTTTSSPPPTRRCPSSAGTRPTRESRSRSSCGTRC